MTTMPNGRLTSMSCDFFRLLKLSCTSGSRWIRAVPIRTPPPKQSVADSTDFMLADIPSPLDPHFNFLTTSIGSMPRKIDIRPKRHMEMILAVSSSISSPTHLLSQQKIHQRSTHASAEESFELVWHFLIYGERQPSIDLATANNSKQRQHEKTSPDKIKTWILNDGWAFD